jgi:hypothetical protein
MSIPINWAIVPIKTRSKNPGTIVGKNWQAQASADPGQISEWRSNNFGCNWGLLLGPKSGVIDVEYDSDEGQAILDAAVEACGVKTVTYKSAKSVHRLFRYDERFDGQKAKVGIKGTEWRFGQDSAQSVIPPSIHETGGRYEWLPGLSPAEVEVAELPNAMWNLFLDLQLANNPPKAAPAQETFRETTGDSLVEMARSHAELTYDWPTLLAAYGWTFCRTRGEAHDWYRPGKNSGSISGTVNFDNSGTLRVFSSSVGQLEPESSYDKFAFICAMQYGDDPAKAAKAILPEDVQKKRTADWIQAKEAAEIPVDLSGIVAHMESIDDIYTSEKTNLPYHLCNPDGFIGDFVQHLEETAEYSCPEFFLSAALSLLAVVTGRKVQDYRGTRTNLFCVSIGPSGAGKDHARKAIRRILKGTGLEGPESLKSGTSVTTVLDMSPATLCQVDEMGQYLKAACSDNAPAHLAEVIKAWTTLFTSPDSYWLPAGFADAKNIIGVEQPHLCIHGTTTPEMFFDALSGSHVASGFVGRMLTFISPDCGYAERKNFELKPIPDGITNFINGWIEIQYPGNLQSHFDEVPILEISPEAKRRLNEHFDHISSLRITEDPARAAIWSRCSEKTSRLAMLHTISRGEKCTSIASADWAIAVANALTRRMVAMIFSNVADSEHHRRVQRLSRIIKDAGIISMADLSRKTQWLPLRDRQAMVAQLLEAGLLLDVFRESKTRPSRGLTADIRLLKGSGWQLTNVENYEHFNAGDVSS